ncbi:hypothetical protein AC579_501 [Pseudocercospora musae]|uniref:REJ domain-containing protein n=1 Tax=Pseudocercospora musae TaxID=113226 RepID=A0A139I5W5_9PEZI|nr:hypothetical protein AC579_501 [Pseudocercospora musae]
MLLSTTIFITTLLPTLTLTLSLQPQFSIILTTLSPPTNHTLTLTPNTSYTSTPTTTLPISKIHSQNRSLNLLSDCQFSTPARPGFIQQVDGSITK